MHLEGLLFALKILKIVLVVWGRKMFVVFRIIIFFLTVRNPLVSSLEKLPHFMDVKRSQVNCLSEISVPSSCHTESYKCLLSTLLRFFFNN